jgi:hypothetical protein
MDSDLTQRLASRARGDSLPRREAEVRGRELYAARRDYIADQHALPGYLGATNGTTAEGTPIGNLAYASVCFVIAAAAVYSVALPLTVRDALPGRSRSASPR